MANFIFQESQRFRQFWIWAVLILVTGIAAGSTIFSTEAAFDWEHATPFGILAMAFYSLKPLLYTIRIRMEYIK